MNDGISWGRGNLIRGDCFWVLDPANRGSWFWRAICKLRELARPMIQCEVGDGATASFWYDNQKSLGPLIELVGERGPSVTGLNINAVVADALISDGWWLDRSRSRSPIITLLKACLPSAQEIIVSAQNDKYVWYPDGARGSGIFSASETWRALHPPTLEVFWHKKVWFSGRVPKHTFIAWVAAQNRMVTRDRLIRWGLNVPASCVLCSQHDESRQHLFFDCSYSNEVWTFFISRMHLSPPQLFEDVLRWLEAPSRNDKVTLIVRLTYQAVL